MTTTISNENNTENDWLFGDIFSGVDERVCEDNKRDKIKNLVDSLINEKINTLLAYIEVENLKVYRENDIKIKYRNAGDSPIESWGGSIKHINMIKQAKRIKQTEDFIYSLRIVNKKIQDLATNGYFSDIEKLILDSEKMSRNIDSIKFTDIEKIAISFSSQLTNGKYDEPDDILIELFNGIKDILLDP